MAKDSSRLVPGTPLKKVKKLINEHKIWPTQAVWDGLPECGFWYDDLREILLELKDSDFVKSERDWSGNNDIWHDHYHIRDVVYYYGEQKYVGVFLFKYYLSSHPKVRITSFKPIE